MNPQSYSMPNPIVQHQDMRNNNYSPDFNEEVEPGYISTAQLYEALYDIAFHPMFVGDISGKVIKFNEKFSLLFGYRSGEMERLKSSDFFKTNDNSFISFVEKIKEKGIANAEVSGIKKSGEIFPCRISSVYYQSDNGEQRFLNTLVNISEHISARWNLAG